MNKKEKYHRFTESVTVILTKVKKERAKDRYEDQSRLSDTSFI